MAATSCAQGDFITGLLRPRDITPIQFTPVFRTSARRSVRSSVEFPPSRAELLPAQSAFAFVQRGGVVMDVSLIELGTLDLFPTSTRTGFS